MLHLSARITTRFLPCALAVLLLPSWSLGDEGKKDEKKKITYVDHVAPVLREHCFNCHNQDTTKGGLNMTTYAGLMEGGGSGGVIEPGDAGSSYLYMLVTHESEPFMPPNSPKLSDDKLAVIRDWIQGGALENSGSIAKTSNKPRMELASPAAGAEKPEGPPPMPPQLSLEPVLHTARSNAITALAASPWAPLIAVAGQQQVLLYHADSMNLLGVLPFPEGTPQILKFSRNGQLLLAGGGHAAKSGRVVVWNVTTGERVIEVGDEYDEVLAADISPDQSLIALGGPSKVVRVYSTSTRELQYELRKHTDWIYAIEFSPDNVLLATSDRNGGMFVWEAARGAEYLSLAGHPQAVPDLTWRIDGNILASCSEDGTVKTWEMENGKQVKSWNAHGGGALSVEYARDGRIASCGRDKVVKIWDGEGKQQKAFEAFSDLALEVVWKDDLKRVVAGDWTGEVRIFSIDDGAIAGHLTSNPPLLASRLEQAKQQLATREAEHKQLTEALAASQSAANKAATELEAIKKEIEDLTAAEKASQMALAEAKQVAEKAKLELNSIQTQLTAKQKAQATALELAKAAGDAAAAAPEDAALREKALQAQSQADAATAESIEVEKKAKAATEALKQAEGKMVEAQTAAEKITSDLAAMKQRIEAATTAQKATAEKAAADKGAADKAAEGLAVARAEVDKWNDALRFAQQQKSTEQAKLENSGPTAQ